MIAFDGLYMVFSVLPGALRMPAEIASPAELKPGDFYEDCAGHPCVCMEVCADGEVRGVSLVDGSFPRSCDVHHCGIRRLTPEEAWLWRRAGPADVEIDPLRQWWGSHRPSSMPPEGGEFQIVFGSDVVRDGIFLEIGRIRGTRRDTVGEVFRSDVDGRISFTAYTGFNLSPDSLEELVRRVQLELQRSE